MNTISETLKRTPLIYPPDSSKQWWWTLKEKLVAELTDEEISLHTQWEEAFRYVLSEMVIIEIQHNNVEQQKKQMTLDQEVQCKHE